MINKSFTLSVLVLISLLVAGSFSSPFSSTPIVNIKLSSSANVVVAASDQSMVVVGYQSGSIVGYSMNGNYINNFNSGSTNPIKQLIWLPNIGPLSLDTVGNVYLWYKNGTQRASMGLGSGIMSMTWTLSSGGTYFVSFVSQTQILEYSLGSFGFSQNRKYYPVSGSAFQSSAMYSSGYNVLFTTTINNNNTYTLYSYSCSTGNISTSYYLGSSNYVQAFAPFTNGNYVMLLNNNYVYSFSTNLLPNNLGSTNTYSQVMTTCLGGPYIVTASFNSYPITVWSPFMTNQQTLNYPYSSVVSMSCTATYLVSLDSGNNLAIETYLGDADIVALVTLAGWIIGVIVAVAVAFVVGIIICICCCCCRAAKGAADLTLNNSMGQQLIITSPAPTYNATYTTGNYNANYNTSYNTGMGMHTTMNTNMGMGMNTNMQVNMNGGMGMNAHVNMGMPTAEVRFETNNFGNNNREDVYIEARF